jgi:hypothetical protein
MRAPDTPPIMFTDQIVGMKPFRTAITSIMLSMVICTIRTLAIATTTVR